MEAEAEAKKETAKTDDSVVEPMNDENAAPVAVDASESSDVEPHDRQTIIPHDRMGRLSHP